MMDVDVVDAVDNPPTAETEMEAPEQPVSLKRKFYPKKGCSLFVVSLCQAHTQMASLLIERKMPPPLRPKANRPWYPRPTKGKCFIYTLPVEMAHEVYSLS
jgi:hypothetical protein